MSKDADRDESWWSQVKWTTYSQIFGDYKIILIIQIKVKLIFYMQSEL